MDEFQLAEGIEFIELNKLLKILDWANSGGEANMFISDGEVYVNGVVETRKRKKIRVSDRVQFNGMKVRVVD